MYHGKGHNLCQDQNQGIVHASFSYEKGVWGLLFSDFLMQTIPSIVK